MDSTSLASAERTSALLRDPTQFHEPLELHARKPAELVKLLEVMKLIRVSEEQIADMVTSGEVKCPCHLAVGQEAAAVGVTAALDPARDRAFGAHRSHGHYLGMGGGVDELFAEILGKETGCSHGMGGSMHLVARDRGLLGTVPIVGATIPMAVGAAIAAHMDGRSGVAVAFFGDGATEEGIFHESMNLAASMRLPAIFACENNLFSSHLHIKLRQPDWSVARYGTAHGMASETVDGNDIVAVLDATERAVARGRAGEGPTFLELVTYRWRGHVGPREDIDVGVRRNSDLPVWKKRDPIGRLATALIDRKALSPDDVRRMDERVRQQVDRAVTAGRAAPYPAADAPMQYLYAASPI
jgi:TPP-dependent pyruvate/acetoin dehydrogenase alpha subunit